MVGDDALVTALVGEGDVPQVQDGGVLHHAASRPRRLRRTRAATPHVGEVLRLCVVKRLLILPPGEGHRGGAAAGGLTSQTHVAAEDDHRGFRLRDDLRFGKVV